MKSKQTNPRLLRFDRRLQRRFNLPPDRVAGLDEVGRGPLAGPVVAGAVLLNRFHFPVRIDDSKRLSPSAREAAYRAILPYAQIGVGFVGPEEIDRIGIHRATALAMRRALKRLPTLPVLALIDGAWVPSGFPIPAMPIVRGDSRSLLIACASIVAKVIRDRWMLKIHRLVPEYGFHRHKGYGTPEHLDALRLIGPSLFHRFSFEPVKGGG